MKLFASFIALREKLTRRELFLAKRPRSKVELFLKHEVI